MKKALLAAALCVGSMIAVPAAANAAPLKCGNHMEKVDGGQQYERKFYWGNCSDQGVKINVWYRVYAFENFSKTVCAPANSDTEIGHNTNYLLSTTYVKDTAGAC